ncbi:MAG: DNA polymerase III subunit alpha [Proteobacteria bacterium]|nr:DNA polymerase III subunit alpha [Pseudomonadota bacterium]
MKSFIEDFKAYNNCVPPGVRLPEIKIEKRHYKELSTKEGCSNFDFLKHLCKKGLKEKGINEFCNKKLYISRLKMELDTLNDLGFVDYILLNWDILNYCRENDIPVGPGRGSAAGSLVLFLIGVTDIDSVRYELFFERFVSKSRAKKTIKDGVTYLDGSLLADVDNDIAYEHRQKVIEYIEQKHPSRTCKILTLNTLSGKLCIKECGKIVGEKAEQDVNAVSDMIPKKFGKISPLSEAYEESPRFKEWADENDFIYLIAKKIEGLNKNTGVHPSGIAIAYQEISEICPVQLANDGSFVTGYDMNWVSELMVKFDILGLRTLSVIYDVCNDLNINIYDVDLDDPEIYKPLSNEFRCPQGLFQIEADTNFRVCRKVKPKSLEELSAVIAIARPGALEFLDSYSSYIESGERQNIHDFFNDILDYTGGIPLYQEQLMKMAVKVGFTLDEAEQLRRIVGKKKVDQMPAWKIKIEQKISENKIPEDVGDILWKVAEDSANYSFNKSHSIAYATLSAWTTYLKFKYPQQFFLSLLKMTKFEPSPQEEINSITQELSFFDMKLLPPDLGLSNMDFSKEGFNIRFGLNSIKGVSEKSLNALRSFRKSKNPNKFDIFVSAKQAGLNIGILSALIQAGALSSKDSRSLTVLEAQSFNLLTDREKRNVMIFGERHEYRLLDIIAAAKEGLIADDGKLLMKESRFETFRKKYVKYKGIYLQNKKFEKFASWYFEKQLLGYSYSYKLKNVFKDSGELYDSLRYYSMPQGDRGKFIGVVEESFRSTSRNGNKYLKLLISDEYGKYGAMMCDNRRGSKFSEYINAGNKPPEKNDIISLTGSKGDDILFIDNISKLNEKIFMKLSDVE